MIKKERATTQSAPSEATACCAGNCCCVKKIFCCAGTVITMVFAILAFIFSYKNYQLEILRGGGKENVKEMNALYASQEYIDYVTENQASQIEAFYQMVGVENPSKDTQADTETDISAGNEATATTISQDQISQVLTDAHFYGNADARIVILSYSDLLCPYCQRHYNDQTLETVVASHPDDVAMVFKNYPIEGLHPTAPLGAKGLYCAGKVGGTEAYYGFLPKAMAVSNFTDESILALGAELGLGKQFEECYASPEAEAAVQASNTEGSTIFGVNGTPGNIVLDRETGKYIDVSGAQPVSAFENAVATLLN